MEAEPFKEHASFILPFFERVMGTKDVVYGDELLGWLEHDLGNDELDQKKLERRLTDILHDRLSKGELSTDTIAFVKKLLSVLCQKDKELAKVATRLPGLIEKFFTQDFERLRRVLDVDKDLKISTVLERYIFDNRDTMWDSLQWMDGKKVSPVTAASKSNNYLVSHLEVASTAKLVTRKNPEFWTSSRFLDSLEECEVFLSVDEEFWVEEFFNLLLSEEKTKDRLFSHIKDYFRRESLPSLLHYFGRYLDNEMPSLLYHLFKENIESFGKRSVNISRFLASQIKWKDFTTLLYYNSFATKMSHIYSIIMQDDRSAEMRDDLEKWLQSTNIKDIRLQYPKPKLKDNSNSTNSSNDNNIKDNDLRSYWSYCEYLVTNNFKENLQSIVTFVLLQSVSLFLKLKYHLSRADHKEITRLMESEGLDFECMHDQLESYSSDEDTDSGSDSEREKKRSKKRKEKKKGKKKCKRNKVFLGWRFPNDPKQVIHNVVDLPQYFQRTYLTQTLQWFATSHPNLR
eukprot:TRINITY_DN1487_c0_g1_i1.p1 TRINITY_DN1487_c0_g1~~TRINITY_DN1487_c0_g1_i1.p1  ORF type:complete len:514 (+),score=93.74 TRINITY_DN1487_c0_g1_i1:176-1717(+)